jgi:hypothetical protein
MDWWTFFFGVWAGAATVMMLRYRRVARQALDLAESCNKGWAITIDGLRDALTVIDSQQNSTAIENGMEIIARAQRRIEPSRSDGPRPVERKDLVN